jgi:dihydroflavonol-4-reductase
LIDENAACHPVNEYEKSKYEGERLLGEYYERRSIPITILRPSTVFGEGSNSESFLGWMRSIKNRTFRFIGGKAYANYVYVGDVVEALVSVSKAGRSGKEDFIVSDTKTMREFVRYAAEILGADVPDYSIPRWLAILSAEAITPMAKVFGKRFPLTVSRVKALTDRRIFSSEKIKKELGFQPKFGVMKGLQRTLMWYQREGLL